MDLERPAVVRDRLSGMSLTKVAAKYDISRALVCRLVNDSMSNLRPQSA
jgi:transposase